MRTSAMLTLALALLLAAPASGADLATPEDLARLVFESLKKDQVADLEAAMPVEADVAWTLAEFERLLGEETAAQAAKTIEAQGGAAAVVAASRKNAVAAFQKARERSAREFDWNEAEFDGFELEKDESIQGISAGDLEILVRAGGARYRFGLHACGKVGRGWVSSAGVRFRGMAGCLTVAAAARRAFEALKDGDYELLEILLPTEEDMNWALEEMARSGNDDVKKEVAEAGGVSAMVREARKDSEKAFERSRGKAGELDWEKAVFGGVDEGKTKITEEDGIVTGDIHFLVEVGDARYLVKLNECARLERGWVCADGLRFLGPAE